MLGEFTWSVLEKDMEGLAQRFKAVSRNVANADTPGYTRRNVSFEDQLGWHAGVRTAQQHGKGRLLHDELGAARLVGGQ